MRRVGLISVPGARRVPQALERVRPRRVLFQSWSGKFADNPRAISEELHRRGTPHEHVWVMERGTPAPAPPWARSVDPEHRRYLRDLGSAGVVVGSNSMPVYFRKKPGVTYLQTWHGTPLKRIGFDIEHPDAALRSHLEDFRRDIAMWDFLVSPNAFSTDVLRRAFRYEGRVLETGYPRNDVLSAPDRDALAAGVRRELGIPAEARVVLYAPTLRDGKSFSLHLRLDAMADALGEEFVILLRAHQMDATAVSAQRHPRVHDVSSRPEVRDLYLVADVLVTDYSSTMFDFAVTRKPMLFFTYDLEEYRDRTRGFYFDFEADAPGPLLTTTGDVIEHLRNLEAVQRRCREAYDRFHARFCHLEDGHAAARVVDVVFGGQSATV